MNKEKWSSPGLLHQIAVLNANGALENGPNPSDWHFWATNTRKIVRLRKSRKMDCGSSSRFEPPTPIPPFHSSGFMFNWKLQTVRMSL